MSSILVVDDDLDTCCNMADLLGGLGFVVDTADGGDRALEKARQQSYELGLLDLRMPAMDSLTLCRQPQRLHPRMVTMIITACAANSLVEEARDAGARHILPKPVDVPNCWRSLNKPCLPPTEDRCR
jgi:CheY-like chemotaxis protein